MRNRQHLVEPASVCAAVSLMRVQTVVLAGWTCSTIPHHQMGEVMVQTGGLARFSFGATVSIGFNIFFKNFFPFIILALILFFPTFLMQYYAPQMIEPGSDNVLSIVSGLVSFLLYAILTAALIYGTYRYLSGKPAQIMDSLVRGIQLIFPVIGVAIVTAIVIFLGFLAGALPGIGLLALAARAGSGGSVELGGLVLMAGGLIVVAVLATMLWVVIPAAVIERAGVFASLGRSRFLTRGHRWSIFGIFVLIFIAEFAAGWVAGRIAAPRLPFSIDDFVPLFLAIWVISAFVGALRAVFAGVGYFLLRAEKEGANIDAVAAVFD